MNYRIQLRDTSGRKICVDPGETEAIYLYPGEVKARKLEDNMVMTDEEYEILRKETAAPRARRRALGILSKGDRTEQEVRDKLARSLTDRISLEEAVDFLKSHGYLNDLQYAEEYLQCRRKKKSFRQIRADLMRKGVPEEIIKQVLEGSGKEDKEDISPQFEKYIHKFPDPDRKDLQKIYAHFARKGYPGDVIRTLINEYMLDF